jgi:flagellar protein FliS
LLEHNQEQVQLLVKLYEGAINFIEAAVEANQAGEGAGFRDGLQRARRIIEQFKGSLDYQKGGAIAKQLGDLYDFMLEQISQAELTHDVHYLKVVVEALETLLDGWRRLDVKTAHAA